MPIRRQFDSVYKRLGRPCHFSLGDPRNLKFKPSILVWISVHIYIELIQSSCSRYNENVSVYHSFSSSGAIALCPRGGLFVCWNRPRKHILWCTSILLRLFCNGELTTSRNHRPSLFPDHTKSLSTRLKGQFLRTVEVNGCFDPSASFPINGDHM